MIRHNKERVESMPAKDIDHDIVVHCLKQSGWTILAEQNYISIGDSSESHRRLYIDIQAQSHNGKIVLIEVKALDRSPVHQLMELLGQYLVYRAALDYLEIDVPLYVAVPVTAYQGIFSHILGQQIMQQHALPLMIYDPVQEAILQWMPQP
ncbi:MAG: hypothetical protein CL607_17560 [Anaerolineaceae bacterium]|nr:hypothetical protein [Anaerolineaceae bacterium]